MNSQAIEHEIYCIEDVSGVYSPGLLIFRELVEANLDEMIRIAGAADRLCPHCKTHKTREITRLMLDRGIQHHKCATIAEAEMLASAGVEDVLIAYQMVGPNVERLFNLSDKFPQTRFTSLVDNHQVVDALSEYAEKHGSPAGVLVDLETGMARTGISIGESAIELIEMIEATPRVQFEGLHWYDGHNRQPDLDERRGEVLAGWKNCIKFRDRLLMSGFEVKRIVAAGTGSFPILAETKEPGLQLSPGTTTFFDAEMSEQFPELNCSPALLILTRVVSCNRAGHLTLDVGHKSCAADQPAGARLFFPTIADAREVHQTEEHCVIETTQSAKFQPGSPIIAIPRHACPTSAVHQFASVVTDGKVSGRWEIAARDRVISV